MGVCACHQLPQQDREPRTAHGMRCHAVGDVSPSHLEPQNCRGWVPTRETCLPHHHPGPAWHREAAKAPGWPPTLKEVLLRAFPEPLAEATRPGGHSTSRKVQAWEKGRVRSVISQVPVKTVTSLTDGPGEGQQLWDLSHQDLEPECGETGHSP